MFNNIRADIQRLYRENDYRTLRLIWYSPGVKSLMVYRLGIWLRSLFGSPICWPIMFLLMPFYWLLALYVRLAFDIIIDKTAKIGPGLYIGHFGGIYLKNCRLGATCSIHQEVRLEPLRGSTNGPIIGDNVWIGAHATIRGQFQIGDGVTVGAGAQVKKDIPADRLVLGNPARVVQVNYNNSSFL